MADKTLLNRLGNRVIEESQLLAERKWIVDTLAKIRQQRNCLQTDRKTASRKFKGATKRRKKARGEEVEALEPDSNIPSTSAVNLMQCAPKGTENSHVSGMAVTNEEIICNQQELDLIISDCIFGNGGNQSYNMEEDDDDDDIMLDMSMLMNPKPV